MVEHPRCSSYKCAPYSHTVAGTSRLLVRVQPMVYIGGNKMEPKFKVGDVVKIRKPRKDDPDVSINVLGDLITSNEKGSRSWVCDGMDQYDGFVEKILCPPNGDCGLANYWIENVRWTFHEDWLSLVVPVEEEKDKLEDGYEITPEGFKTNKKNWDKWLI